MEIIATLIFEELRFSLKKIISLVFLNIFCCILFYYVFILGLGPLLPTYNSISLSTFLYAGIIALIAIMISYGYSGTDIFRRLHCTKIIDQTRTSNIMLWHIYLAKSIAFILLIFIQTIISSLFLLILIGGGVEFLSLLQFWLYLIFSVFFLIQFGVIAAILIKDPTIQYFLTFMIILPLTLLSGVLFPTNSLPRIFSQIVFYLPTTAIIEGGRELILNQIYNPIYLIYILCLNILSYFLGYYLFKRNLLK